MKRYLMGLLVVAVMAVVTACSLDELPQEKPEVKEELGYLQLSNFVVVSDTENKENEDEIETGTGNAKSGTTRTRADEGNSNPPATTDFSNYFIEIIPAAGGEPVWSGEYASNLVNGTLKPIGLEPGKYTVWAYQDSNKGPAQGVAVDAPYYAGCSEVEIVSTQTTNVTVTCRLFNIRVTVELSADLKDMFQTFDNEATNPDRLMTNVAIGKGSISNKYLFEKTTTHDSPYVYFEDVAAGYDNVMDIELTGVFYTGPVEDIYMQQIDANKWKKVKMTKKIVGSSEAALTGGQWRRISIDIEHNDEGNAQFIFTIDNYVYDKTITVSTMTMYENIPILKQEEAIPEDDVNDPMAPQVKIEGVTADEDGLFKYAITADMIDTDVNEWTSFLKANIVIPDGSSATVSNLYAEFKQTSPELLAALETAGFDNGIVPLFPSNGVADYVSVATGGTKVSLKEEGMDAFYQYPGTHRIRLHTEGSDGRVGFADVDVTVSQSASAGPKIIWKANGAATNSYVVLGTGGESVDVTITSSTGLISVSDGDDNPVGMTIKIESDVLVADELEPLGLASEMDLFYPASYKMETRLRAFGFLPIHPDTEGEDTAAKAEKSDDYRYWKAENERSERAATPLLDDTPASNGNYRKYIHFDISSFLNLLAMMDNVENKNYKSTSTFTITAIDESGKNTQEMVINVKR